MKTRVRCAAVIIRAHSLLLSRQRRTDVFVLPGGEPLPGEDHLSCLKRLLEEELDIQIKRFKPLALLHSQAKSENAAIENHLYHVEIEGQPMTGEQTNDIAWVTWRSPPCGVTVTAWLSNNVMPLLYQQELIK